MTCYVVKIKYKFNIERVTQVILFFIFVDLSMTVSISWKVADCVIVIAPPRMPMERPSESAVQMSAPPQTNGSWSAVPCVLLDSAQSWMPTDIKMGEDWSAVTMGWRRYRSKYT